eukprot:1150220-Pelagomonas_calceolata.AAC.1
MCCVNQLGSIDCCVSVLLTCKGFMIGSIFLHTIDYIPMSMMSVQPPATRIATGQVPAGIM